jgi:hypothetical protein
LGDELFPIIQQTYFPSCQCLFYTFLFQYVIVIFFFVFVFYFFIFSWFLSSIYPVLLGDELFPVIEQTYFPSYQCLFYGSKFPAVVKVGPGHAGWIVFAELHTLGGRVVGWLIG